MPHSIYYKRGLLSGLVNALWSKQVQEVLEGAGVTHTEGVVPVETDAEGINNIVGVEGSAVGEDYALFEDTGPNGSIFVAGTFFSQIGLRSSGTPIESIKFAIELVTSSEGRTICFISTHEGDGLTIL